MRIILSFNAHSKGSYEKSIVSFIDEFCFCLFCDPIVVDTRLTEIQGKIRQ